jgi:hypothetical protein
MSPTATYHAATDHSEMFSNAEMSFARAVIFNGKVSAWVRCSTTGCEVEALVLVRKFFFFFFSDLNCSSRASYMESSHAVSLRVFNH